MKKSFVQLSLIGILVSQSGCSKEGISSTRKENNVRLRSEEANPDQGSQISTLNNRKRLEINLDVGALQLRFAPIKSDYEVSWVKGDTCDRIQVTEDDSGLNIRHIDSNQSCGGSQIEVLVRETLSTQANAGAGTIVIEKTEQLLPCVRGLKAQVMAGTISNHVSAITTKSQWSQVYASYSSNQQDGINLDISLGAGQITFEK